MYVVIADEEERFADSTYYDIKKGRYSVSNYGRIYDKKDKKFLNQTFNTKGYKIVSAKSASGKTKSLKVHRLVAWEFNDGYDESIGRTEPNHLDDDRANNYYKNIPWATSAENSQHAFEHGRRVAKKGKEHYRTKYPEDFIVHIKSMLLNGYSTNDIIKYFGYIQSTDNIRLSRLIGDIKRGQVWKHVEGSTTIETYCIYIDPPMDH